MKIPSSEQLRESCKFSNARWAAWLEPVGGSWIIQSQSGLSGSRHKWLQTFLQEKRTIIWLVGALNHRRKRTRETRIQASQAGCKFLTIFPGREERQLLLVGNDTLNQDGDAFWRVVAMGTPERGTVLSPSSTEPTQPQNSSENLSEMAHESPTPEMQVQVIREFIRELLDVAVNIKYTSTTDAAWDFTNSFKLLLQGFLHRSRLLVDARFAQLAWFQEKETEEHIPHALQRENPTRVPMLLTDVDATETDLHAYDCDELTVVHSYLMTVGENLHLDDYSSWAGYVKSATHPENPGSPPKSTKSEMGQFHCRAVMGFPISIEQEPIGTLLVADDRLEKSFTKQDFMLTELLAPMFEVAVRFARLNAQLQERITAQHQAESCLIRSSRLAAVGEMAAGVAHELNNPLTTVTGFVELTLNELPPDLPMHADLELALKEALRARGIVRDLLDFSRPSQDMRVPTDLNDLISQVLNLVRHLLRMNNLTIRLELWDDLPRVIVDPNKIQQVILNLMQNAIQAMPKGGTLTVRTELTHKPASLDSLNPGRWVSILVQDTGVGIPEEVLGRIFEPFYTRPTNEEWNEPGVGLGLSVSYGIIQSHGGSIEVESIVSQGSSFTVHLPLGES